MKFHCFIVIILKLFFVKGESENKTVTYSAEELLSKIFNFTTPITARQSNYGLIKFEDTSNSFDEDKPYGLISFEEQSGQPFKFEDDQIDPSQDLEDFMPQSSNTFKFEDNHQDGTQNTVNNGNVDRPNHPLKFEGNQEPNLRPISQNFENTQDGYGFQDDNRIEEQKPLKKKRRRRRRKPRYQGLPQGYPGHPGNFGPQGQLPIPGYQGNFGPQGQPPILGYQGYVGNGIPQGVGQPGQYPYQYPYPAGPAGQFYRPPRRRKPSVATEALSAITGALSSIAQYDDYQCVPRLLCEAAGGGALGSSNVLQNIAGLQPLLTLLAAYNGISSSPLFIFGRAVFLGMTSKGNLGTCRYGYPQCPTDPEQLVHYLNNHNGGFFRFFNAPHLSNHQNGQQNLQQFYNQLSVPQNNAPYQHNTGQLPIQQNYGLYPSPLQQYYGSSNFQGPAHQGYGFQDLNSNENGQQNDGLNYPYPNNNQQGYGFQNPNSGYGNGPQNYSPNYLNQYNDQQVYGFPNPNLYGSNVGPQTYGSSYPYQNKYGFYKMRFKNNVGGNKINRIEKRIQNKPTAYTDGDFSHNDAIDNINHNSNWAFPENNNKYNVDHVRGTKIDNDNVKDVRGGKSVKFPEEDRKKYYVAQNDFNRKGKGIFFPNNNVKYVNYYAPVSDNIHNNNNFGYASQNKYNGKDYLNYQNNYNKLYQNNINENTFGLNNYNNYPYQNAVSNYQNNYNHNNNDDGDLETVYIVRGNGDPNNPEIVKVKPGEIIE